MFSPRLRDLAKNVSQQKFRVFGAGEMNVLRGGMGDIRIRRYSVGIKRKCSFSGLSPVPKSDNITPIMRITRLCSAWIVGLLI